MLYNSTNKSNIRCTKCLSEPFDMNSKECYYNSKANTLTIFCRLGLYEDIGYSPKELVDLLIEYEKEHSNNQHRINELMLIRRKAEIVETRENSVDTY